ncbi:hypothetical protein HA402_011506 [Bradysia odoriphaga]|nr:hypothetical protein HA402_011506 [Bradysia odoriphaga]
MASHQSKYGQLSKSAVSLQHQHLCSSLNNPHSSGGGVLVAVRSSLSSEEVIVPGTENVEIVFVKINIGASNIYVCCMYIPSRSPVSVYFSYAEAIEKFFQFVTLGTNDSAFVTGDFNMPEVTWSPDPDKTSALLPGVISCSGHSAKSWIYCTDPDNVTIGKSVDTLSRVDFPFHEATEFRFTIADHRSVLPNVNGFSYDFKKADYDSLSEYLARIDWTGAFSNCPTVEDSIDTFYDLLLSGLEQFVPVLRSESNNHPPWYHNTSVRRSTKLIIVFLHRS